jgi:hypothetical protein
MASELSFLKAMLAMGSITIPRRMLMGVNPPQLEIDSRVAVVAKL